MNAQPELPAEYLAEHEDRRTALMAGSEVAGVFVNSRLREQTERFLASRPAQPQQEAAR